MTVKELMKVLSEFDPDKEVYIRYIRRNGDRSAITEDYWVYSKDRITSGEYNKLIIDITDDE
jgi:hypothetical protein